MQLFDDFVRTDDSPASNTERLYTFLNRSAWPVCTRARALCESWFRDYPTHAQDDLWGRFTSKKDEDHNGSYFELLLHELLTRLGARVTVHPAVRTTSAKPDFLVDFNGSRFYLEATVNHASDGDFLRSPILDTICDWIDEMGSTYYYVSILFSGKPTIMPKKKAILAPIQRLMEESDPDDIRRRLSERTYHRRESTLLSFDDWYARVSLLPRTEKEWGVGGHHTAIRSGGGMLHTVAPKWRESIRSKAKKKEIGNYDAPCVIALNVLDGFASLRGEGVQAVYGTPKQWQPNQNSSRTPVDSGMENTLWSRVSPNSWRDNLAAVWMFKYAEPVQASPSGAEDCVFLKPSSEHVLPESLTQVTYANTVDGKLNWCDGLALDALLEVPEIAYDELRESGSP